jgi:hypothetical protein
MEADLPPGGYGVDKMAKDGSVLVTQSKNKNKEKHMPEGGIEPKPEWPRIRFEAQCVYQSLQDKRRSTPPDWRDFAPD